MKTLISIVACGMACVCAAEHIELKTGSTFEGTVVKASSRGIIVDTKIGRLKLSRDMLSARCMRRITSSNDMGATAATPDASPVNELKNVRVNIEFSSKAIDRDKNSYRRMKREVVQSVGVLTIELSDVPDKGTHDITVQYVFKGKDPRGRVVPIERGEESVTWKEGEEREPIVIESRPVGMSETKHTGDTVRRRGMEIEGYSATVLVDGTVVAKEEE